MSFERTNLVKFIEREAKLQYLIKEYIGSEKVKLSDTDCFVKKFDGKNKERYVLVVYEGIRFMGRLV